MQTQNTPSDSFVQLKNIFLIKESFERERIIADFSALEHHIDIEIDVNYPDDKNYLVVDEILKFTSEFDKKTVIKSEILMTAIFEIKGTPMANLEEFGHVNGAAIIYPFIREHLATKCLKAGIGNILLPPMNFVQKYKDQNTKQ